MTYGQSLQYGIASGQFNFDPQELAYITKRFVLDHQPLVGVTTGLTYTTKPWTFSLQGLYSSGLRGGFADSQKLPSVLQFDVGIARTFDVKAW